MRVLVTSASTGMRREVATVPAGEGAEVVAVARSDAPLAELVTAPGGAPHTALAIDVGDAAAWTAAELAGITHVVCAAGILGPDGHVGTYAAADCEAILRINALSPGFGATRTHEVTLRAGPELTGAEYHARAGELERGGVSPRVAAKRVAFLLSSAAAGITAKRLWDPWREEAFRSRLGDEPDLATLRRIDGQFFTTA